MAPERFVACLTMLGWSHRHLIGLLRCDTNLATRWSDEQATGSPSSSPSRCGWRHWFAAPFGICRRKGNHHGMCTADYFRQLPPLRH